MNLLNELQEQLWRYIVGDSENVCLTKGQAKYLHTIITREATYPFKAELYNYALASKWEKLKMYLFGTIHREVHPGGLIGEMIYYRGKYYLINTKADIPGL